MPELLKELEIKAKKIHSLLVENQQTLALAESCTGGLLSYYLTMQPSASIFFIGSIVSYSYLAKTQDLEIPSTLLSQKGAVNETVCRLMVQGVKKKWNSDWVLSITGVAGPGKEEYDPPIGTVFIGILGPGCDHVEQLLLNKRNRQDIRHQSAIFALDFLCSRITMGAQET